MSLVLVITVAFVALADAGYHYSAPSATVGQSGNQQGNPSIYNSQHIATNYDKPLIHSVSYKDYVYLKKDNNQHNPLYPQAVSHAVTHSRPQQIHHSHNLIAMPLNSGYSHSLAPSAGTNLATGYVQTLASPSTINNNNDYVQSFTPVITGNTRYPQISSLTAAALNNGYAQPLAQNSISSSTQTLSNAGSISNNGYPLPSSVSTGINLQTGFVPIINPNLNSGHVSTLSTPASPSPILAPANNQYSQNLRPLSSGLSNGYVQTATVATSNNYNNGYSQSAASSATATVSSGYRQPLNGGYIQNIATSSSSSANNAYIQTAGSNLNTGYPQNLESSASASLNNGLSQSLASSVSSSFNSGYSQPLQSGTASVSSSYTPLLTSDSLNSNIGYSQSLPSESSGHRHPAIEAPPSSVSLNNNYLQPSVTASTGYTQTSVASGNVALSGGYSQTSSSNLVDQANNEYTETFNSPGDVLLNTGHDHSSAIITSSNVNSGIEQNLSSQLSTSSISSSLDIGNAQTTSAIANDNLNLGFTQVVGNNGIIENSSPVGESNNVQVAPAIFKHIYFHVPPPDVEEQKVIRPLPPPKKNYKIIFIKVPSQESKVNVARLQQLAQMQNAVVEDKTLIYVLVKKPEVQEPIVVPKKTPSEHEVFFVKYNGNPLDLAAQVNEELDKTGSVQSIVPLQPGLANGHK